MSIEAMKQALGALLSAEAEMNCEYGATELLRQAIEQAEKQEPVAWYFKGLTNRGVSLIKENDGWIPLYTTPPAAPVQESVGRFAKFTDGIWREVTDGSAGVPLYTTPQPQREWVGLTEDEIDTEAFKDDHAAYFALGAIWANKRLREKNT